MSDEDDNFESHGAVITKPEVRARKPHLFRIILHNDDFTPMDFVVDILKRIFRKSHAEATDLMMQVHQKGSAICGVYPFDIAETKVSMVLEEAKKHEHPLQCTMERT